jgi:hypothetical protein
MANIRLIFESNDQEYSKVKQLEVFATTENSVCLVIEEKNEYPSVITLDKLTAIKFSKELRKQIALID